MDAAHRSVEAAKDVAIDTIRANPDAIQQRIARYRDFFARNDFVCPLPGKFARTFQKGFSKINPLVDALLICEMSVGVLMGVQDLDKIEGALCYDIARGDKVFPGFRSEIECKPGEIILRDQIDIIATYFQGPDKRTSITASTSNVIFFAFAVTGIDRSDMKLALQTAVDLLRPAAGGADYLIYAPS